jgi:pyruvate ferredoxin oxidoreductase gamma subunit
VVTAAELLSVAAFQEGKHAQAVPSFGSERMGAPVVSYCRIHDREIRLREPIVDPDILVVQDPTLFRATDVFCGLRQEGYVVINTRSSIDELGIAEAVAGLPAGHVCTVPATELALRYVKSAKPNAALLGAVAALTGLVNIGSVTAAIRARFSGKMGEANVRASDAAYALTESQRQQPNA